MSKKVIFISLFLISLVSSIVVVAAQDSVPQLIALSTDELTFYGEKGIPSLSRTLKVVGIADTKVTVELFPVDLYDNSSGKNISSDKMAIISFNETADAAHSFSLSRNEEWTVNITLNTSEVGTGTYRGAIIVTATTTANMTTTKIEVTAKIEKPLLSETQWQLLVFLVLLIIITLLVKKIIDYEPLVIILGLSSVAVWIYTMVNSSLGDLNSIVSTMLIGPFALDLITYVKDKRTEKVEKEKTSRETQNKGLKEDMELIRNLIGEMATHFASFKPNLYEEKMHWMKPEKIETSSKVLYNESGVLSREIWDKYRRQGMISDLPLLELEKYYDFIKLYNCYYSCAMKLTKDKKHKVTFKLSKDKKYVVNKITNDGSILPFVREFEKFRHEYAELETVIYVHLSYYLGLFTSKYLAPLKIEYPRVTRTLLYYLVDYGVLHPGKYIRQENYRGKFRERFEEEFKRRFPEDDLKKEFKERFKDGSEEEFQKWKKEKFEEELFKKIIKKWKMSADELRKIIKEIYREDKIQIFYRKVEDDFQIKHRKLKTSIKNLPLLDKKCVEKEKEKQIAVNVVKGNLTLNLKKQEKQEPKNT